MDAEQILDDVGEFFLAYLLAVGVEKPAKTRIVVLDNIVVSHEAEQLAACNAMERLQS